MVVIFNSRIQDRRAAPSASDGGADNGLKNISDFSVRTDIMQDNGALTYSEHNLYGAMHGLVSRNGMLERKPEEKPFIIARSSFSGTAVHNGVWLGDSTSTWDQYIQVIRQMLVFASFGTPIVGADTGGFGGNVTETLLARWAWLGAFNTFYRNHNEITSQSQEFYRYELSTRAGKAAGETRLRLLDYIYTFIHKAHTEATPAMWPVSWVHPDDENTINIESQFYFGPHLLVSPALGEEEENQIYVPNTTFYNFWDLTPVVGQGESVSINIPYEQIGLHIKSGAIIPLRTGQAMTTAENRKLPFHIVVAPDAQGEATGELYLDDGISLDSGTNVSEVNMVYQNGTLEINGNFGYDQETKIDMIVFAGQESNKTISIGDQVAPEQLYDPQVKTISAWNLDLTLGQATVTLA